MDRIDHGFRTTLPLVSQSNVGSRKSEKMPSANTGKKKRRCPYCPFSSYYSASLTVHLRRHTGEKPYQCIHCHKVFGDRSNMNSHVRRYHRDGKSRKASDPAGSASRSFLPSTANGQLFVNTSSQGLQSHLPPSKTPVIASVYSKEGSNNCSNDSMSHIASPLRSISDDTSPTMITLPSTSQTFSAQRLNRRKSSVVRKKIPLLTDLSPEGNIFTPQEENFFTRSNLEDQSDEENLHALHTSDQMADMSFPKDEKCGEGVVLPCESSSDCRASDDEHKNGSPNSSPQIKRTDIDGCTSGFHACRHCEIFFKSCVLHTIHMGCHGFGGPFKCNVCGVECKDAVEFNCHIARGNHNGQL